MAKYLGFRIFRFSEIPKYKIPCTYMLALKVVSWNAEHPYLVDVAVQTVVLL